MRKNDYLNQLFDKWIDDSKQTIFPFNIFVEDGIVDENCFEGRKILFALKDLHLNKEAREIYQEQGRINMREHVFDKDDWRTWNPIALWTKFLLNDSSAPFEEEINDMSSLRKSYLSHIAFINLKKEAGDSSVPDKCVLCYAKIHSKEIRKEIEIIEPELIIACSAVVYEALRTYVFPKECKKEDHISLCEKMTRYGHYFNAGNEVKPIWVVQYCHPTNRGRGACTKEEHCNNMRVIRQLLLK